MSPTKRGASSEIQIIWHSDITYLQTFGWKLCIFVYYEEKNHSACKELRKPAIWLMPLRILMFLFSSVHTRGPRPWWAHRYPGLGSYQARHHPYGNWSSESCNTKHETQEVVLDTWFQILQLDDHTSMKLCLFKDIKNIKKSPRVFVQALLNLGLIICI